MRGAKGTATEIDARNAAAAAQNGECFELGEVRAQEMNRGNGETDDGTIYAAIPKPGVRNSDIKKGTRFRVFLDAASGAIVSIPIDE